MPWLPRLVLPAFVLATMPAAAATFTRHLVTLPVGAFPSVTAIGASGELVGAYYDVAKQACRGFLLNGTTMTTLPDMMVSGNNYWLQPTSIASNGDVAGLAMQPDACLYSSGKFVYG